MKKHPRVLFLIYGHFVHFEGIKIVHNGKKFNYC